MLEDPVDLGFEILHAGVVPPPPREQIRSHFAYPIALDIYDGFAAVSFAVLNLYERGWWCVVKLYREIDGQWVSFFEYDSATTDTPFRRPSRVENRWVDWMCDSPALVFGNESLERRSFFGIAPIETARLTVAGRDVPITPWSGAFVATAPSGHCELTGYAADGTVLGTL